MICVTNRHLVEGDFVEQIRRVLRRNPLAVVLREKDLLPKEYKALVMQVLPLCEKEGIRLVMQYFKEVAYEMEYPYLQVTFPQLEQMQPEERNFFTVLGVSVHSAKEAKRAEELGATYLVAGHVFLTDCKKGVPARGLSFLQEVCDAVSIPVYAIGGVTEENVTDCIAAGAAGGVMMSGFMKM